AAKTARKVVEVTRTYFTLDSLEYLKKGGRIGPTQALVGGILGLRPVLQVVDGNIASLDKVRGKKKVISMLQTSIVDVLQDVKNEVNIAVGQIQDEASSTLLKSGIEKNLDMTITNEIVEVGVTIGTHAGPGAMAISYCKKYEAILAAEKVALAV
ncbi:MAG: DegV family EDD domain-containing protein, partial [Streptococcaceae bacterium]|nr:DegV family EDD domain-containing protein [Streptococcaceae bacterium]